MSPLDLITLGAVKDWLNTAGSPATGAPQTPYPPQSDILLGRLITSVSAFATSYLQRQIQPATYSEVYNGTGQRALTLRHNPVISVSALTQGTTVVQPRAAVGSYGFVADTTTLYLDGCGSFCRGVQNIAVTYRAGYQQADTVTVPGPINTVAQPFSVSLLSRPWNSDQGVSYATSGAALTAVTVTPTVAGTYQVAPDQSGTMAYNFAAADDGASVVITYGYTPEDVQQALVELVGERFKVRSRIGENSQTIGDRGTTTSFSRADMNESIRMLLNAYRQVVPIQ